MRVAVHWGQGAGQDGGSVGFWWVTPTEPMAKAGEREILERSFRASKVEFSSGVACLNEQGDRRFPGGPRGWIEADLVSYEPFVAGASDASESTA